MFGLVLAWNCRAQPPLRTPAQLEAEHGRDLQGWMDRVEISVPTRLDRPTGASVSVAQLGHKIPRAAQKSFTRAKDFSKKGDHARAASELEQAVERDPEFAAAYVNLGVEYGQLGLFEEAGAVLRRALELDAHASIAYYNMGVLLVRTGDLSGAEHNARRAVAESEENAWAHLLLGVLLSRSERTRNEGLRHVKLAARSLPEARGLIDSLERMQ